jgi:hypothetical protein
MQNQDYLEKLRMEQEDLIQSQQLLLLTKEDSLGGKSGQLEMAGQTITTI